MIDYSGLIKRLRSVNSTHSDAANAAEALKAQAKEIAEKDARIAELEVLLAETKSLLPQKIDEAPCRPPFISDWWSIAVLERRKGRKSEREYKTRIAELEAENKTLRLALEASVAFAKHVQEFLYINDYGDYELGSGFENNTDETIKVADAALKGERG